MSGRQLEGLLPGRDGLAGPPEPEERHPQSDPGIRVGRTKEVVIFVTVATVYARESFEIFAQLFLNENASWLAAGLAVIVAVLAFAIGLYNKSVNRVVFTYGYWAYLALALWFGYEALEHLHWL